MDFQILPFPIITLAAGVLMASLAFFSVIKKNVSGSGLFSLLMIAGTIIAVLYFFELSSFSMERKIIFLKAEYIGVPYMAPVWLLLAFHFCGYGKLLRPPVVLTLLIVPVATMIIAFTNDFHFLSWTHYDAVFAGRMMVMRNSFGVWHWVHIAYSYTLFLAGAVLFIRLALTSNSIFRGQAIALVISATVPWIGSIIFGLQRQPLSLVDTTPTLFAVSGIALWWAIFRYHLLNVMPAAKQAIVENMRAGIVVVDVNNRILEINSYIERAFQLKSKEILGKPGETILSKLEWIDQGLSSETEKLAALDLGETRLFLEMVRNTIFDLRGRRLGDLIILFDVTERKQAENSLRQTEELLFQVQKMEALGRMAGGIAHDFNNILTIILNYSENMLPENECSDQEIVENVEEIMNAVRRGQGLTTQLLAFSEQQMVEKDIVQFTDIVGEMEKMVDRLMGSRIQVSIANDSETGMVWINKNQIEQIILNLVINARDAMPDGGTLTIKTGKKMLSSEDIKGTPDSISDGVYSFIEVIDTGEGISPDEQKRIFEPFFTTKDTGRGAGLGLSTVYGIVKQNRGRIDVQSGTGNGTSFCVYFPVITEDEVADFYS